MKPYEQNEPHFYERMGQDYLMLLYMEFIYQHEEPYPCPEVTTQMGLLKQDLKDVIMGTHPGNLPECPIPYTWQYLWAEFGEKEGAVERYAEKRDLEGAKLNLMEIVHRLLENYYPSFVIVFVQSIDDVMNDEEENEQ